MSISGLDSSVEVSNLLERYPEVLPQHYARIAWDRVAEAPFQAALEARKPFQRMFNKALVDHMIFGVHMSFQYNSEGDLVGVTRRGWEGTTHLPLMKASVALRPASSSSTRGKINLDSPITVKKGLRWWFRAVRVQWSGSTCALSM
jgi:hypothetical protein